MFRNDRSVHVGYLNGDNESWLHVSEVFDDGKSLRIFRFDPYENRRTTVAILPSESIRQWSTSTESLQESGD